jgi:hypothetical protein
VYILTLQTAAERSGGEKEVEASKKKGGFIWICTQTGSNDSSKQFEINYSNLLSNYSNLLINQLSI